jgi:molybdopterin-containing oxidoreductase family iron-sulfur binding subunit
VGPRRSLTGLNADTWIDCKPGTEVIIARALAGEVPVAQAAEQSGVDAARLQTVVTEYQAAKPALVLAGGHVAGAAELFQAVAALNRSNGAVGTTIRPDEALLGYEGIASPAAVRALVNRMNAGDVPLIMIRGANPAYTMP